MGKVKFSETFMGRNLAVMGAVAKAHDAGLISKDEGYALIEANTGLHKDDTIVEKLGKGLIAVVGTVATAGLGAALAGAGGAVAAGTAGAAGAVGAAKSPTQQKMSALETIEGIAGPVLQDMTVSRSKLTAEQLQAAGPGSENSNVVLWLFLGVLALFGIRQLIRL